MKQPKHGAKATCLQCNCPIVYVHADIVDTGFWTHDVEADYQPKHPAIPIEDMPAQKPVISGAKRKQMAAQDIVNALSAICIRYNLTRIETIELIQAIEIRFVSSLINERDIK